MKTKNEHSSTELNSQSHNDNSKDKEQPFFITKSYRPKEPPTFTEEELEQFREGMKNIRTDGENLLFDERRQMWYWPVKLDNDLTSTETEQARENESGCTLF